MRLMEQSAQQMTREQMQDLLIESARLLMLKDNVIRDLIKSCKLWPKQFWILDFGFWIGIINCLKPLNLSMEFNPKSLHRKSKIDWLTIKRGEWRWQSNCRSNMSSLAVWKKTSLPLCCHRLICGSPPYLPASAGSNSPGTSLSLVSPVRCINYSTRTYATVTCDHAHNTKGWRELSSRLVSFSLALECNCW